jgi:hypothetical protein
MKRSVLTTVLALLGVLSLVAQVPAAATDVAARHAKHQSAQAAAERWASFHVGLGSGKRANCSTTGHRQKLYLRCDRYDKQSGQEVAVKIYGGKARRLINPSDAIGDPVGKRLRADDTWRRGSVRCRAMSKSLRCRDVDTGHGFVLTATRLRVH